MPCHDAVLICLNGTALPLWHCTALALPTPLPATARHCPPQILEILGKIGKAEIVSQVQLAQLFDFLANFDTTV
jgi:hypothetical protein